MNSVKGDESFLKSQAVPEHLREVEDPYRDEDNDQNRRRVPLRSQSEYRDDLGDEEEGDDASSNILEDSWEVYEERLTEAFKRIGKSEDDGFDKGIGGGNLSMTAVSEKDAYRQAAAHTLDALTQKVKIPVRPFAMPFFISVHSSFRLTTDSRRAIIIHLTSLWNAGFNLRIANISSSYLIPLRAF
jgi:hypothetical protein